MSQEPQINFHTVLISLRKKKLKNSDEKKKHASKRKKRLKIKLQKKNIKTI